MKLKISHLFFLAASILILICVPIISEKVSATCCTYSITPLTPNYVFPGGFSGGCTAGSPTTGSGTYSSCSASVIAPGCTGCSAMGGCTVNSISTCPY